MPRELQDLSLAELRDKRSQIVGAIERLNAQYSQKRFTDEARETWNSLNEQLDEVDAAYSERETREARVLELASRPENTERIGDFGTMETARALDAQAAPEVRTARDLALRTIERFQSVQPSDAADRVDRLVRGGDPFGRASRYVAAVGSSHYAAAFEKMLRDPLTGHLRFTPQEVEAVRRVTQVESERALATTTTGVPVPFQLDPSIMISGAGALNPLRRIARVEFITEGTWKGATSAEVTASYGAEASEVTDATPAMLQPSIEAERGTAFIPFSIEVGQDWRSIEAELGGLLADGRDVLDATKMLTGTGTNEPGGLLNIGGTGGLTTTQRLLTAGVGSIAIGDVYALKQALPARFLPRATWTFHPTRLDSVYRLVAEGSTTEPKHMPAGREGPLVGKPAEEWSAMDSGSAAGQRWAVVGDFRRFLIADRLGFSVEFVPHLFGAASRFPTGQRGFLAVWRTGSGTLVPNAFRYGQVRQT